MLGNFGNNRYSKEYENKAGIIGKFCLIRNILLGHGPYVLCVCVLGARKSPYGVICECSLNYACAG